MVFRTILIITAIMIFLSILAGYYENIKMLVISLIGILAVFEIKTCNKQ